MKLQDIHIQGDRADQPAATDVAIGTLYGVTDEGNILERSDGTDWQPYSPTVVASGITELVGDVLAGPGSGAVAANIPTGSLLYSKIQDPSTTSLLLGRGDSGTGPIEEITLGPNLVMVGTELDAVPGSSGIDQLTGDVTAGPGSGSEVATIANDAVTYAKMQNTSAPSIILGRGDSGAGNVEEIILGTNLSMSGTTLNATGGGGGGGGLVLLGSLTASNSASLDFTSLITSLYDNYLIQLQAIKPVSSGTLNLRVSSNNGSSWLTGSSDYQYAIQHVNFAAFSGIATSVGSSAILICGSPVDAAQSGADGEILIYNPLATIPTHAVVKSVGRMTDTNTYLLSGHAQYTPSTAIDAVQLYFDSGNIASGTIRLYGYEK